MKTRTRLISEYYYTVVIFRLKQGYITSHGCPFCNVADALKIAHQYADESPEDLVKVERRKSGSCQLVDVIRVK